MVATDEALDEDPSIPVIVMHSLDALTIARARHLVNSRGLSSRHVCAVMRLSVGPGVAEARRGSEAFGALLAARGDVGTGGGDAEEGGVGTEDPAHESPQDHPYVLYVNEVNEQVLEYVRSTLLRGEQPLALQKHLDSLTRP
mmetsp:Transcript_21513/g.62667  ORF Transcript_21513/g.62667 Transcript_21513/m.62667 type:complete len:142 (-) Transcript_21513:81-506(-)